MDKISYFCQSLNLIKRSCLYVGCIYKIFLFCDIFVKGLISKLCLSHKRSWEVVVFSYSVEKLCKLIFFLLKNLEEFTNVVIWAHVTLYGNLWPALWWKVPQRALPP